MNSKQSLELTIRAAQLIKTVSVLVGVHDEIVAALIVQQAIGDLTALAEFTKQCKRSAQTQPGDV